ncbi:hypothetical protein N7493_010381 [Penicillium malachiteum]|uniref:TM7S3/TM198-like domain-containing protein n=1 Tax=Penicillium malachiteum TaxID=1324776 RepID=A0AAD6HCM0_9EURO|nr:hypothetical protein N7493_010381 [Penicillium malachiteum]
MRWYLLLVLVISLHWRQVIAAPTELARDANPVALLDPRDEVDATATATDASSQTTATVSGTASASTTNTNTAATTTASTSTSNSTSHTSQSSQLASDTSVPSLGTSSSGSGSQSSSNSTKMTYSGGLPIQPKITPALGAGGFILLAAGAALAFVGIRKPRIYIFLSTGFVAALGVTVLIEYVMSPPASNAVQGAYLVAIVSTGAIFGGLALVFKEITEGLCCLLGGFCIGMWLITLKAGGLVTKDGPKVGFILAFAGGFYCLSFSRYTRSYGSILCTAFSGATAIVLGIDCYSRAGLKEFWLYIWHLNDDTFPLNTYTYPITRSIRVESAVNMIVAIFGVIFQLRLWKVIKERREKEEAARREATKAKEEAEAEMGRRIEEKNMKERAEWEQMYGNGSDGKTPSMSETAVTDSRRGSDNFGSKGNSVEMKEIGSADQSAQASESGNNLEAVEEAAAEAAGDNPDAQHPQGSDEQATAEGQATSDQPGVPASVPRALILETNIPQDTDSEHGAVIGSEVGSPRSKRFSGRSLVNRMSWRSAHEFSYHAHAHARSESQEALVTADSSSTVAGIVDDAQSVVSDRASLVSETDKPATEAAQETAQDTPKDVAKDDAVSEATETNPFADQKSQGSGSEPETIIPAGVQDTETTAKDVKEGEKLEVIKETVTSNSNITANATITAEAKVITEVTTETKTEKTTLDATSSSSEHKAEIQSTHDSGDTASSTPPAEVTPDEQTAAAEKNEDTKSEKPVSENKSIAPSASENKAEEPPAAPVSVAGSVKEIQPDPRILLQKPKRVEKPKLDTSTVQNIPERTSRIVNNYRTREWAKHLADADAPEFEPIEFEPEVQEEIENSEEAPAPVDMEGLLQTPLNAQPPPVIASTAPTIPEQFYIEPSVPLASPVLPQPTVQPIPQPISPVQPAPTPISPMVAHNMSSIALSPPGQTDMAAMRNSIAAPHLTVTIPHEPEPPVETPRWSGPPPLLAVRETMMRNRLSSTSLRYDPWTASRSQSRQSLGEPMRVVSPTMSSPQERDEIVEETVQQAPDDVPLSQRRAMLQRQTGVSSSSSSSHSLEQIRPPAPPVHAQTYVSAHVPAHGPAPVDPNRSAAVMAAWRQSVREDINKSRDTLAFQSPPLPPNSPERSRNTWKSVQQMREASTTQLDNVIADEMQKGNMTDLHRKAMRRMQASANRKL